MFEKMKGVISRYLPAAASIVVGVVPIVALIGYYGVPRKMILSYGTRFKAHHSNSTLVM